MTGRKRSNLLLTGLAAVLLLLVLMDSKHPDNGDTAETLGSLFNTTATAVSRIEIDAHDQPTLSLALETDPGARRPNWWLQTPLHHPAQGERVKRLLALESAPIQKRFDKPDNLKPFQLDPPLARFRLDDRDYQLGGSEPLKGLRYIGHGRQIFLVEDNQLELLLGGPSGLLSNRLIPPAYRIHEWSYQDASFSVDTDGNPHSTGKQTLDSPTMRGIINAWQDNRAFWVELSDEVPPPGDPVEIEWHEGHPASNWFVIPTPDETGAEVQIYMADKGLLYHLPGHRAGEFTGASTRPEDAHKTGKP